MSGATFTVTDSNGDVVGSTSLSIPGAPLYANGQPAVVQDLAPVTNFQLNIVADYTVAGGPLGTATFTEGAGRISYLASSDSESGITAAQTGTPGPQSVFGNTLDTGEDANVFYFPLPWPWSLDMTSQGNQIVQPFEVIATSQVPPEPSPG